MNCKRTIRQIEERSFGRNSRSSAIQIRLHLSYCKNCRQYEKSSVFLDQLLSKAVKVTVEKKFNSDEKEHLIVLLKKG